MTLYWLAIGSLLFQRIHGKQHSDFAKLDRIDQNFWATVAKEANAILPK